MEVYEFMDRGGPESNAVEVTHAVITHEPIIPPTMRMVRGKLEPFPTGYPWTDASVHVPPVSLLPHAHVALVHAIDVGTKAGVVKRKALPPGVTPKKLGHHTAKEFAELLGAKDGVSNEGAGVGEGSSSGDSGEGGSVSGGSNGKANGGKKS